ncbi:MAG: hypothetical protein V4631_00750 [Pseudomonadota bacterium]
MPVYVQHEILGKVSDVFNAESIWQAPGLALFARRPLLRDLLERSPRELRGRAPTRCFSHVTLMLAQEELDDDRHLTRGARLRDLTQSLTALHQKDFGDLLGSDDVRYDVVGTDALEPGEVEVKFGHAVYLPSAGEGILYKVSTSLDSAVWQPVCPIYLNQRLALIGHDAARDWPFSGDGAILLVNDGPDAPIEVQVRPKGAFDCSVDAASGHYTITRRGGDTTRLLMKIERPGAARAPKPAAVWKARPETEQTAVPFSHRPPAAAGETDATFAPVAQQRVSLVGLALPRLSRYLDTGATGIEVGLDRTLGIAADGAESAIRFAVDGADQLHVLTGAGRQPITAPASFTPVDSAQVDLLAVAPEMAERYCATLLLPHPSSMPVASGVRLVFGRSAPMLAALRVLDSPRFLQRAEGAAKASADRLGLSRNAFSFEAANGGFQIGRISPTQALYHLDAELNFVASIGGGDQPYLLPHGHHLVAGHYVLRFDA